MNRKQKGILALAIASLIAIPSAIAVTGLPASISSTVTLVDPPLQIAGVTEDGASCTNLNSCSATFTIGAVNAVVVSLSNPASVAQSAKSSTTAPSACGFTITDSSVSVPALGTATLTISISVSSAMTPGTLCTFSTVVS